MSESQLVIRCLREQKGRYVAAASKNGMKLVEWVLFHLDNAVDLNLWRKENPNGAPTPLPDWTRGLSYKTAEYLIVRGGYKAKHHVEVVFSSNPEKIGEIEGFSSKMVSEVSKWLNNDGLEKG